MVFPAFRAETQRYQHCFISLTISILQRGRLLMLNNNLHFLLEWQIIFLSAPKWKTLPFKDGTVKIKQPYFYAKVNSMKGKCMYVFVEGRNRRAHFESWGHPVPHQDLGLVPEKPISSLVSFMYQIYHLNCFSHSSQKNSQYLTKETITILSVLFPNYFHP